MAVDSDNERKIFYFYALDGLTSQIKERNFFTFFNTFRRQRTCAADCTQIHRFVADNRITDSLVSAALAYHGGKTLIKQKLGKTLVIYEVFREKGTKQEVQIFLSYDGSAAKSDIMKAFENKSKELQEKVSKMLDL